MKRIFIFLFVVFTFFIIFFPSINCTAEDEEGFYIKNMDVKVVANPDRSYDITETIDVYFTKERHGIIRTIPTTVTSSLEKEIRLENVMVTGAPFEYSGDNNIKIGNPDLTVSGDKRYTLSYTLWHYADTSPDADYLYLNLIGTQWNTDIKSFSASIQLPSSAIINECTLTGGAYGSTTNNVASYEISDSYIIVSPLRGLAPHEGVTINVKMPEGSFDDAKTWEPDMIFHSISTDFTMDRYGTLTVHKLYDVTINQNCLFRYHAEDNLDSRANFVPHMTLTLPNLTTYEENDDTIVYSMENYVGQRIKLGLDYIIQYKVLIGTEDIVFLGQLSPYLGNNTIESVSATFQFPYSINDATLMSAILTELTDADSVKGYSGDYQIVFDGSDHGHITYTPSETEHEPVYLKLKTSEANFIRTGTIYDYLVPLVGLLLLIIIILLAYKNRLTIIPVPSYYPPDGLSPVELGYIVSCNISSRDVVSLLYYWASKGYMKIALHKNSNFTLYKIKELDSNAKSFEQELFHALWSFGKKNTVNNQQLSNKFYVHINQAKKSIKNEFTGSHSLINTRSALISHLIGIVFPLLYLSFILYADSKHSFSITSTAWTCIYTFIGLLLLNRTIRAYHKKRFYSPKKGLTIVYSCCIILLLFFPYTIYIHGNVITLPGTLLSFVFFVGISMVSPYIKTYSTYGSTMLEQTLGFKQFLLVAEQDRLKMLLEDTPDYYYNILPYAQVLGVSRQWTTKFDSLITPPPDWLENTSNINSNRLLYESLMSSITYASTCSPSSSSDGDSGDYSSGGCSGGGSGGGGGSSW